MKDIIIIGAGPSGMSAAVYVQRAGKSCLLLEEKNFGGQIINTAEIENYPGLKSVSGIEFATSLFNQAKALGAEIKYEKAIALEELDDEILVKTSESAYTCKAVIIATGAKNRPMGIPEEEKYVGSGISYCATCDGAFFKNRDVAVIGGGNTALEDADTLSGIAKKVYLVHRRDQFRGEQANVDRLRSRENVEFVLNSVPKAVDGDGVISGLTCENVKTGEQRRLSVQGIFVAIGQIPDNENFSNLVDLDKGYVKSSEDCTTKSPGIFTAGDCRTKAVRQLTTAASDGTVAALAAVEYIKEL